MGLKSIKRKGTVEVQINWIFVLVAGAMILLLFIGIVMQQKDVSERKLSVTILSDLSTIINGASVSTNTVNVIKMPYTELIYACDGFSVGQASMPIGSTIVFAPSMITGNNMIAWTQEWNMPYKVMNFLYLTSEEVRTILVYEQQTETLARRINMTRPERMNVDIVSKEQLKDVVDLNNYKVRIVYLTGQSYFLNVDVPSSLKGMRKDDLSMLYVSKMQQGDAFKVDYYSYDGTGWSKKGESFALDDAMLFGAIFTDDHEAYNCMMQKAFGRLKYVNDVYLKRTDLLMTSSGEPCRSFYRVGGFEDIMENSEKCAIGFPSLQCDSRSILDINAAKTAVENDNDILQRRSCALLY